MEVEKQSKSIPPPIITLIINMQTKNIFKKNKGLIWTSATGDTTTRERERERERR